MFEMITSSPIIAHERSLLLDFLTSHRITGEILVYEMKTWQSGSVRERPTGQCHTPPAHRGPCTRASADVHRLPSQRPREVAATPLSQACQGYEGKLMARPPSQEVSASPLSPGLGLSKPCSVPPSYQPCGHSLVRWVSGRTQCALSSEDTVMDKPHGSWSCSPGAHSPVGQQPMVPRGGECVSGLGD